ncbi:hypothetical protein PEC18_03400 [Paucibacter sp. O1-1]|nr:hypothetical protein [Paucibacter sp. O1-1]MDA3824923.1 hypothetical protein [Paucibacter sp. O1-1]
MLVDRKLNVTTHSKQVADMQRWAEALRQNPGVSVRIEVPTEAARKAAIRLIRKAGTESSPISVVVVK